MPSLLLANQQVTAALNGIGVTAETIDSWVKLDGGSEDLDEEMEEMLMPPGYFPPPTPQTSAGPSAPSGASSAHLNHHHHHPHGLAKRAKTAAGAPATAHALPLHSLAAFSLFLSMPLYTEAVLQDRRRAQMLLRLALGVSDDGQGGTDARFVVQLISLRPVPVRFCAFAYQL